MTASASRPILDETYLKDEDKEVLSTIIQKTVEYNRENKKKIEIYLTGSSLADSRYNDIDLVVVSKSHKPKDLALLVGKWVDGEVFLKAPYPYSGIIQSELYRGPHPQNCYRISVSKFNRGRNSGYSDLMEQKVIQSVETEVSEFDITAGQKLEDALANRKRKHIKITS